MKEFLRRTMRKSNIYINIYLISEINIYNYFRKKREKGRKKQMQNTDSGLVKTKIYISSPAIGKCGKQLILDPVCNCTILLPLVPKSLKKINNQFPRQMSILPLPAIKISNWEGEFRNSRIDSLSAACLQFMTEVYGRMTLPQRLLVFIHPITPLLR